MIQQSEKSPAESVPHSINLKATMQSIFRFAEDRFPRNSARIDPSGITYINHRSLLEMLRKTVSTIKSDALPIEPAGLKDILFVTWLSLAYMQFHLNMLESGLGHLSEYLDSQLKWLRYLKWTRTHDAYRRYQQLKEQQRDSRQVWEQLNRAYGELRNTIRRCALAIVKADVSPAERQWIIDVENLEHSRAALAELLDEIEDQQHRERKLSKFFFHAPDRLRIYNKFRGANSALKNLPIQLEKTNLDHSFVTANLVKELRFKERRSLRWRISDKYILRQLNKRQFPLKTLLEGLDRLLQSESHKLNLYANRVSNLGYLLRFTPSPSNPQVSRIFGAGEESPPLPDLVPDPSKSASAPAKGSSPPDESPATSADLVPDPSKSASDTANESSPPDGSPATSADLVPDPSKSASAPAKGSSPPDGSPATSADLVPDPSKSASDTANDESNQPSPKNKED